VSSITACAAPARTDWCTEHTAWGLQGFARAQVHADASSFCGFVRLYRISGLQLSPLQEDHPSCCVEHARYPSPFPPAPVPRDTHLVVVVVSAAGELWRKKEMRSWRFWKMMALSCVLSMGTCCALHCVLLVLPLPAEPGRWAAPLQTSCKAVYTTELPTTWNAHPMKMGAHMECIEDASDEWDTKRACAAALP